MGLPTRVMWGISWLCNSKNLAVPGGGPALVPNFAGGAERTTYSHRLRPAGCDQTHVGSDCGPGISNGPIDRRHEPQVLRKLMIRNTAGTSYNNLPYSGPLPYSNTLVSCIPSAANSCNHLELQKRRLPLWL